MVLRVALPLVVYELTSSVALAWLNLSTPYLRKYSPSHNSLQNALELAVSQVSGNVIRAPHARTNLLLCKFASLTAAIPGSKVDEQPC